VKIFDEILVNSIDQYSLYPKKVKEIVVAVQSEGAISIQNSGVSIPIKKHEKEKGPDGSPIWIPELIFGHLLTSSNYNDTEQRVTGGRNGYGSKLTNVFSKQFSISISDGKKLYEQTWSRNMSSVEPPCITGTSGTPFVRVVFMPDYARFGGAGDFLKVFEKRTWDAAMWCSKAEVRFNNQKLEVASLSEWAHMHGLDSIAKMHTGEAADGTSFDIVVGHSTSGAFQQCSWVNGIATTKGGSHVDKVVQTLVSEIQKDKRCATLKPAQIKASLFVFVSAVVINPTFSSQTKAECTSKISDTPNFPPKFIKDVFASGVLDDLISKGLTLVSATTGDDVTAAVADDPMRRAMVQMQGIFSELDKNLLVRKLRKGRQKRRDENGKCEGRLFFGQKPGEAETLARIRELYRKPRDGDRMSLQEVADALNAELDKYPTRVRRADGTIRPWSKGTIHAIVRRGFKVPEKQV
jgi:DNA topoisomerase-2